MLRRLTPTTTLLLHLLAIVPARADAGSDLVRVEPEKIRIGVFFAGQTIRVRASTPASRDVVMLVTGPEGPLVLKKKGKQYGFLWMNVGDVSYEAVPSLYLLHGSRGLDEIAAPETLDRLKLGFDALRNRVPATSEDGARELFSELVKLKQREQLFREEAGVELRPVETGRQEAIGEFFLPARTPLGDYSIDVFSFDQGQGELIGTATVHLEWTPVVSSIASMAANHGLLYGCLAVGVAILAGLFTGYLFGKWR